MSEESLSHQHESLQFPDGFWWGAATSAYQIEGGNRWSDWYEWEIKTGKISCGQAANHYELFRDDFKLAHELNQNAHRFSIEWSRLEPVKGQWDERAIEHYHKVFDSLQNNNLKICLTLYHFTLPRWLASEGGWESRKAVFYFTRYVEFVIKEYGHQVDLWLTMNEPTIFATQSYLFGDWPPQVKSIRRWWRVTKHLAEAHRVSYKLIHQAFAQSRVSFAHNVISLYAYRRHTLRDHLAVMLADFFWNHYFLKLTRHTLDFLAINYYFHQRVRPSFNPRHIFHNFIDPRTEQREVSDLGWEIYAPGLFEALRDMSSYNLPIFVTENGVATTNEDKRARYLVSYLRELYYAIKSGVDVRGYFYWSLFDNFEWDKGYAPKFGLLGVDFTTFARVVRPAAETYSIICKQNALTHNSLHWLGHALN